MSKISFFPENFSEPKGAGNYLKLAEGETKMRVLSAPVFGWLDWIDKKPVRYRMEDKPKLSANPDQPVKLFMALVVWDYADERVKIWEVTQAGIRKALQTLSNDEDWGAPYYYDIKVLRSGKGKETEYTVNPLPKKALPAMASKAASQVKVNLEALYENMDPFAHGQTAYTQIVLGDGVADAASSDKITEVQAQEIEMLLEQCDPSYRTQFMALLAKQFKAKELTEVPMQYYNNLVGIVQRKVDEIQSDPFAIGQ